MSGEHAQGVLDRVTEERQRLVCDSPLLQDLGLAVKVSLGVALALGGVAGAHGFLGHLPCPQPVGGGIPLLFGPPFVDALIHHLQHKASDEQPMNHQCVASGVWRVHIWSTCVSWVG